MKMMSRFTLLALTIIVYSLLPQQAVTSGTVVGNGGDPLFHFLEATRFSLVETIKIVLNDPKEQESFCNLDQLGQNQRSFCRNFFVSVAQNIIRLNQDLAKTLFVLKDETLFVFGPDGRPMPVAARTELGEQGPIEFNRDSIKLMAPTQALFLIGHEFQHKASFDGKFVTDNEAIGPFATGRELLDSAAASLVKVARRRGKIGAEFGMTDIFNCKVDVNETYFGATLYRPRLFMSEDLMSYKTSAGENPTDLYLPESSQSLIYFKFTISEPSNCSTDPESVANRSTRVEILRGFVHSANGNTPPDEVLEERLLNTNPICPDADHTLTLSSGTVTFNCTYFGSKGTTNSTIKLNNRKWK